MIDHCGVHLASAAILSNQPGPPQSEVVVKIVQVAKVYST